MVINYLITSRLISKKYITGSDARGNRSKTSINPSTPNKTTKWRDVSCIAEENTGIPNNLWTNGMKPYIKHNQLLMSYQAAAPRRSPVLQLYQGLTSVPKHYHVMLSCYTPDAPLPSALWIFKMLQAAMWRPQPQATLISLGRSMTSLGIIHIHRASGGGTSISHKQRKGESSGPSKSLIIR